MEETIIRRLNLNVRHQLHLHARPAEAAVAQHCSGGEGGGPGPTVLEQDSVPGNSCRCSVWRACT